jgi:predicted NUDIX family NTP pyrophosphohydrolase
MAVTIVEKDGRRRVLLGKHSQGVALDSGQVHLVPSGMTELQQNPIETVRQEFTEELGIAFPGSARPVELALAGIYCGCVLKSAFG